MNIDWDQLLTQADREKAELERIKMLNDGLPDPLESDECKERGEKIFKYFEPMYGGRMLYRRPKGPAKPYAYIVRDLIPENKVCFLAAAPKTGKTFFLHHLALCVITGQPFLGQFPINKRGKVLSFSPEGGYEDREQILYGLAQGHGINIDAEDYIDQSNLFLDAPLDLTNDDHFAQLQNTIEQVKPSLLIIDPFVAVLGKTRENDNSEIGFLTGRIRQLAVNGLSVVIAHHLNKDSANHSRIGYAMRGASALAGCYDRLILLDTNAPDTDAPRSVSLSWRLGDRPDNFAIKLTTCEGVTPGTKSYFLEAVDPVEIPKAMTQQQKQADDRALRIFAAIKENPGTYTRKELAMLLAIPKSSVYRIIEENVPGKLMLDSQGRVSFVRQ